MLGRHVRRRTGRESHADQVEADGLTSDRAMLHEYAGTDQVTVQHADGRVDVYQAR